MAKEFKSMKEVPAELLIPDITPVVETDQSESDTEEATAIDLHKAVIDNKGKRVARLNKNRKKKAYNEIKVPVSGVSYTWIGTKMVKSKKMLTPRQIKAAKRAERLYNTREYCYKAAKEQYGKKRSRAKNGQITMHMIKANEDTINNE